MVRRHPFARLRAKRPMKSTKIHRIGKEDHTHAAFSLLGRGKFPPAPLSAANGRYASTPSAGPQSPAPQRPALSGEPVPLNPLQCSRIAPGATNLAYGLNTIAPCDGFGGDDRHRTGAANGAPSGIWHLAPGIWPLLHTTPLWPDDDPLCIGARVIPMRRPDNFALGIDPTQVSAVVIRI